MDLLRLAGAHFIDFGTFGDRKKNWHISAGMDVQFGF